MFRLPLALHGKIDFKVLAARSGKYEESLMRSAAQVASFIGLLMRYQPDNGVVFIAACIGLGIDRATIEEHIRWRAQRADAIEPS